VIPAGIERKFDNVLQLRESSLSTQGFRIFQRENFPINDISALSSSDVAITLSEARVIIKLDKVLDHLKSSKRVEKKCQMRKTKFCLNFEEEVKTTANE